MAFQPNTNLDQFAVSLAEEFRQVVDDNVFVSNTVMQDVWPEAEERDPGRWLAVPILTAKNTNATAFGQYDPVPAAAQTIVSAATFPWSFYVSSINLSWQELRMIQGQNMRVDLVAAQLEDAIASMNDLMGNDLTNQTKGAHTANGVNSLGVIEATDNGTLFNTYGNINRTGSNAFANWQGNVISKYLQSGIGNASNDPSPAAYYNLYSSCTQGKQAPTDVYSTKQGVTTGMNMLQPQQRLAPGDMANPGFGGFALFGAWVKADDHIVNPTNSTNIGCNYYAVNRYHTHLYYMGPRKGSEFIPWTNNADGSVAQTCRYVVGYQYASSQCRTGGQLLNINAVSNL